MGKQLYSLLVLCFISCIGATAQPTPRYFIKLQSGEVVTANKIQLKSPLFKSNHFLLDDSLKYSPAAVSIYQNEDGYFARIEAGNNSEAFAKRIIEGPRIDKYYSSRTTYDHYGYSPYGYGYGYGMPRTSRKRIYYFSKDDGPLYLFTHENLQEALSDNAASATLLHNYKRDKYINTGITVIGTGLMALGILNSQQTEDGTLKLSPVLYAGAGVLGAQFVFNLFRKDKLTQAIQVYNYQIKQ
ncbi:hypothetical protein H8S95_16625 [Pontibacter sp. KCTC 32443]|uniref:hypothetical protein n=1 Tax=Pontibacter TaxID=323449 RepID=UPI00164D087C|nr:MULTISPECIES: hypothetical protein [Pontibacter]MBC5775705.1 hypothetical protein [Pontibacter sp. KCTC 32443]